MSGRLVYEKYDRLLTDFCTIRDDFERSRGEHDLRKVTCASSRRLADSQRSFLEAHWLQVPSHRCHLFQLIHLPELKGAIKAGQQCGYI